MDKRDSSSSPDDVPMATHDGKEAGLMHHNDMGHGPAVSATGAGRRISAAGGATNVIENPLAVSFTT